MRRRIPGDKAKNGTAHRVPLTPSALALLQQRRAEHDRILAAREKRGDTTSAPLVYVLDGARGKKQHRESARVFGLPDFRGHDLRRTVASFMRAAGSSRFPIAYVLNHRSVTRSSVTAIYDRYSYDAEKRAALAWWDAKLAAIVAGKDDAGKLLPFAAAAGATTDTAAG
jgi:integrase